MDNCLKYIAFILLVTINFVANAQDFRFAYKNDQIILEEIIRETGIDKQKKRMNSFLYRNDSSKSVKTGFYYSYKSEGELVNGKREGIWIFRKNGILEELVEYKLGMRNGLYKSYHTNSTIKEYGYYINDLRYNEWKEFYNNGRLKSVGSYYPDTVIIYNSKERDSLFYNNLKEDKLTYNLKENILYLKEGIWHYYLEDGKLSYIERYEKGKLIKE